MSIKKLVKKLPYPIQQSMRYIYGAIPLRFRYGKVFWKTYNFLQESQWWSREKLEEYQMQQLNKLLHHAYENVPYYRRIFHERGLKPRHVQSIDDLRKLPYLTKDDVRNNFGQLIARNIPKSRFKYVTTSGSTGIPLWFYEERSITTAREQAFHQRMRDWIGYKLDDKCIVLRGNIIKRFEKGERAWWEYNPVDNLLTLSSYHMTEENLFKYIEKLNGFQPKFIQAYPSTVAVLAQFIKEHGMKPIPSIRAILCGSENLYASQRKMLEEVSRCRIFSWYGHTEKLVLAGECEKDSRYHIFTEYGVTELVKNSGNPVESEGEMGEIIGTGFNNYVMPFIRYRTGDLAIYTQEKCSCGRHYPLIKNVEGRLQEYIVKRDNHLIPLGDMQIRNIFDNVKQFQFYQDKKGEVIFNIVKGDGYTSKDTEDIRRELYRRIGDDMILEIRFVDHIPRLTSGKYRFLIQKLPIEFGY